LIFKRRHGSAARLAARKRPAAATIRRRTANDKRAQGERATSRIARPLETPVFISSAYAQASGTAAGDSMLTFLPMVLIFVVFYFLLIRPQQKKQKEMRQMLGALQKGDEIVTAGGVVGRITKLGDQYATVEVAPNVEMIVQRPAISQVLPKGTMKGL
jgi:preprotein translocase subunit YajC